MVLVPSNQGSLYCWFCYIFPKVPTKKKTKTFMMKNLRRTSSWSHRSLLILWNLYKSKSEPLAFLSINHWVSWNDDLVEISIMWSHFVWGSCCKTWDKENRSWVGRRTNFRFMGKKNMEGQNEGLQNLRRFLLNTSILAGALGNP